MELSLCISNDSNALIVNVLIGNIDQAVEDIGCGAEEGHEENSLADKEIRPLAAVDRLVSRISHDAHAPADIYIEAEADQRIHASVWIDDTCHFTLGLGRAGHQL